jgi:hypothetical protein
VSDQCPDSILDFDALSLNEQLQGKKEVGFFRFKSLEETMDVHIKSA